MTPPWVAIPPATVHVDAFDPDLLRVAGDYARHRGKIWEVSLSGSPEEVGSHQVELLRAEMLANETVLWSQLDTLVPSAVARFLIFDIARLRFRNVDHLISDRYRREIAAGASMFAPDPFSERIPSYQRMVYLHSLYDVSLSFEHSPLIGCTSFAVTGDAAEGGHSVLTRAFDFEAGDIFDSHKAIFLVHETGRLAYASVAWPGLIGAVTGMNEAGLALVVHGGRAREARSSGEPLTHTMRDILGEARSTDEAVRALAMREPMVSHIVMLVDAAGNVSTPSAYTWIVDTTAPVVTLMGKPTNPSTSASATPRPASASARSRRRASSRSSATSSSSPTRRARRSATARSRVTRCSAASSSS